MKFNSRASLGKKGNRRVRKFSTGDYVESSSPYEDDVEPVARTSPVTEQSKIESTPLEFKDSKRQSFKEKFAAERAAGKKTFDWQDAKGVTRTYTTELAKPKAAAPKASAPKAEPKAAPAPKPSARSASPDDIPDTQPAPKRAKADDDKPLISDDTERQLGNLVAGLPVGRAALGAVRGAGKLVAAAKGTVGARKAMDEATFVGRGPRERMDKDLIQGSSSKLEGPARSSAVQKREREPDEATFVGRGPRQRMDGGDMLKGPKSADRLEGPKAAKQIGMGRSTSASGEGRSDTGRTGDVGRGKPSMGKRGQEDDGVEYKRGGKVKAFAKGGFVRSADGIAKRGHTRGRTC